MKPPIILAVDTQDLSTAQEWVKATHEYVTAYKLGLEFFLTFGREGVRSIADISGSEIFLDLKLHDIPNTVAAAVDSVASLKPRFLTVHASGGSEMISAAVAKAGGIEITAVTILTSLSQKDVEEVGFEGSIQTIATQMASKASAAGARAIVCSPLEIASIRKAVGPDVHIITPGVRPEIKDDDQKRTKTPQQAIEEGADFLVIGRPITGEWGSGAKAMTKAAERIALSLHR